MPCWYPADRLNKIKKGERLQSKIVKKPQYLEPFCTEKQKTFSSI